MAQRNTKRTQQQNLTLLPNLLRSLLYIPIDGIGGRLGLADGLGGAVAHGGCRSIRGEASL